MSEEKRILELPAVVATDDRLAKKGLSLASIGGDNPPRVVSSPIQEEAPTWKEWKLIRDDKKGVAALIHRMMMPKFPRFSLEMRFFRVEEPNRLYRHFQPYSSLDNDIVTITEIPFLAMRMVWEEAQNLVRAELQEIHNMKIQKRGLRHRAFSVLGENK